MNKVLAFIKGNLIIVISVVLILAFLPVGYIFSGKWNAKVQTKVNDAYNGEKRKIESSGRVTYAVPAVLEGEDDLSESRAPNERVTDFYAQAKAARIEQVNDVVQRGTAFNQGDHVELVPGLLPAAPDASTRQRLGRTMSEAIVGTYDTPSVYQRKLQRLNAGSPPDAQDVAQSLAQTKESLEQQFRSANTDGNLTTAQQDQLQRELTSSRLGQYISRAKSLTFYCDMEAIVNGTGSTGATTVSGEYSVIPSSNWSPSQITESVVFTWLWDFWVVSDILDAAALANSNAASGAMVIPEAPVKRIDSIRVSALEVTESASASGSDDDSYQLRSNNRNFGGSSSSSAASTEAPSFTGREGGTANSPFDIRTAEVSVVVSSQHLPKFLDAIGKVNFMTVTDIDLQEVDVWEELKQGYYYGDDHVVRATLKIETVWLRSWVTPMMPNPVKEALGVPVTNNGDSEG